MSKTKKTSEQPTSEGAVLTALASQPDATAAEVASAAGIGRSTATKVLARLAGSGEVCRTAGGRDGALRLPDCFSLASAKPAAEATTPQQDTAPPSAGVRLKPGQLDGLVLTFMETHADEGPHGSTAVAKALQRSSGAVGNCLVRLAREKRLNEVSTNPRRYSLAV